MSVRPAQVTVDGLDPQQLRQRGLEQPLHGPQARLGRPAVEVRAVVGEVESQPHPAILAGPRVAA